MSLHRGRRRWFMFVFGGLCVVGFQGLLAEEPVRQTNVAFSRVDTDQPRKPKKFPTFEVLVPLSPLLDPFEVDSIVVGSGWEVFRGGEAVAKAVAKYVIDLVVLDHTLGTFEVFSIGEGKTKTSPQEGRDDFGFDIPTALFADGFESGDISAWVRFRASIKKKNDETLFSCGQGAP